MGPDNSDLNMSATSVFESPLDDALRCLEHGDPCSFVPPETKALFASAQQSRLRRGARGLQCRVAQEWLAFHGARLVIDGDFGPATERAVKTFQTDTQIASSGEVDRDTVAALIAPQLRSIFSGRESHVNEAILSAAESHLQQHPLEVGGDNRGPWIRLYMNGRDGREFPWCAGFVSFVLRQGFAAAGLSMAEALFPGSVSCDVLAQRAKKAGRFVNGNSIMPSGLDAPALFLTRRTPTDWTHTGIVTAFETDVFHTIEGNTNDDGNRNGYEVCRLVRGYGKYDFVAIAP